MSRSAARIILRALRISLEELAPRAAHRREALVRPVGFEPVFPRVEHRAVEAENAFARDAFGRGRERGESFVDARAVCVVRAREEVPERERIARACVGEQW